MENKKKPIASTTETCAALKKLKYLIKDEKGYWLNYDRIILDLCNEELKKRENK